MKKLFPLLLALMLVLCSCNRLPRGTDTSEGFIMDDTGIEYLMCDPCITPIRTLDAYLEVNGSKYLTIEFEDPEMFLSDDDPYYKYVFRAKSIPEITVEIFEPIAAHLYIDGAKEPLDRFIAEEKYLSPDLQGKGIVDDSEYTYAIRDAILHSEPIYTSAELLMLDESYTVYIKLLSQNFPGLYYTVVFVRDINGYNYIKDDLTDYYYYCPENVVYRLWENT